MRIAVPLSPLDQLDPLDPSENSENVVPVHVPRNPLVFSSSKTTPQLARIQHVNANSPRASTIHSFPCLERTPLSEIDNSVDIRSSPDKSQLEFRKREQQHASVSVPVPDPFPPTLNEYHAEEQSTPKLITGIHPGSTKKHARHSEQQQQKIEALEREVASLKDFVVELDSSKRTIERLLEEEKEARATMAREFALREGALHGRIKTLKGMLKMVSLEKERLVSFSSIENELNGALKQ